MTPASQAVLIAPGSFWASGNEGPAELLHLADRPFLQHAIDFLAELKCKRIDVVLGSCPAPFKELIGDGRRWGVEIVYHLARDPRRPYARLPAIEVRERTVLLAHAHSLPPRDALRRGRIVAGWGYVPRDTLHAIPPTLESHEVDEWLARRWELPVTIYPDVAATVDVRTPKTFLRATRMLLSGQRGDMLCTGRAREGAVRVGWGAAIHPSAQVTGPAYIGERVTVGPMAVVGPNAVVGAGAIVSDGAVVADAVVEPGTYVGDALTLHRVVAREGCLVDAESGAVVEVRDRLLLGAAALARPTSIVARGIVRTAAGVVWGLTFPVQLATAAALRLARRGPVLCRAEVHTTWHRGRPAGPRTTQLTSFDTDFGHVPPTGSASWKELFLRFLPGLLSVARGDIALVGLDPRTPRVVADLPAHYRKLVKAAPPGLIPAREALDEISPSPEALFAADAVLVASESLGFKLRLVARYFLRRLRPSPASRLPAGDWQRA
jgi:NDP-sugar pyrophosphorylase family protein